MIVSGKDNVKILKRIKSLRKAVEKLNKKYFSPEEYGIIVSARAYSESIKLQNALQYFE